MIRPTLLFFIFFLYFFPALAQPGAMSGKIIITSLNEKTGIHTNKSGELRVNVSPKNIRQFKAKGFVLYSDFGADGNGKTDDIDAIAATHAFANQYTLLVKADNAATYYIGGKDRTVAIRTNTDFGTATFIIDDTDVKNRNASVFEVGSDLLSFKPEGITSLRRNQEKLDIALPANCLISVTNTEVKQYIRYGPNQDSGSSQTDIFIADKNGKTDSNTPILWDFNTITDITAVPIDDNTLSITGGHFITIANNAESKYTYYSRNILVRRSNVVIDGLEHRINGEGNNGAPYSGFITISNCAYITVKNSILTGHKTYQTIGSAGKPVSMGSYDISVNSALNVSFINCSQTNDIKDNRFWGIMGSNYCKNLLYDSCTLSRFDAHKGVANATIRNSVLGHMGINAIGSGTLRIENTTIYGRSIVNLRNDYGSSWQGSFIILNCTLVTNIQRSGAPVLINGAYSGMHDFGYTCYMPERISIENLRIEDTDYTEDYKGPAIFAHFNPQNIDSSYYEKFPYVITKEVTLRNVTTASGMSLRLSSNPFMFRNVKVTTF